MEEDRAKEDYNNYYEIIERIGKGSFGQVHKVKDKKTNDLKAIKIIDIDNKDTNETEEGIKSVINELNNMKKCSENNEFSVKYYEYFKSETEFIIVMELCDNNLENILNKRSKGFSSKEIRRMMIELNETFKIMVSYNIVHRDIKLQNILIKYIDNEQNNFIVKLTDYGISKQITESTICKTHAGTGLTMAPEILEGKEEYDNRCDLWSIGVILYQLYFNEFPYKAETEVALFNNIIKLKQNVLKKTDNEYLDNLIRGLLVYDLDKRLTWDKYFEHSFFDYETYYEIIGDRIGLGKFGKVYKVKDRESNELKAIKIIELDGNENGIKNGIINELKCMKICSNDGKNLYSVRFYEFFKKKNDLVIVMELCDKSLSQVLENKGKINNKKEYFNSNEIYKIMNQLNDTFKIMVKNKIVHRDIKLENILVKFKDEQNSDFISKLTDYGISKQVTNTSMYTSHVGTSLTMAPELLEGKDRYDNKCDLWSIGVIIYQLFFGDYPYKGNTEVMLLNKIIDEGQNNLKETDNKQLDNLIRGLLVKDPEERISWLNYLYHPFFREFRSKEDYKIYYEKLEDKKIGKGGFGSVYQAKDKVTNELRAMKIIGTDCNEEGSESEIKELINELNNMDKCCNYYKNKYSVEFYDYFITKNEFIIIMELCDNNLEKYLKDRKKGFSSEEILYIMTQLNETFKIMVKENIVHRDLKLENILIKYLDKEKKDFIVKLTDYGFSKQVTKSTICKTHGIGTFTTMAPEVMEGDEGEDYDNKCDLWSIGIIIYQLFFNQFPFNGDTQNAIYNLIKTLGLKALKSTNNIQLDDLIRRLLIKDPRERLSWEEYFNHPFFNKSESKITTKISNEISNEITIKLIVTKIDFDNKKNEYKDIYFLENKSYMLNGVEYPFEVHFNELNEKNTELYIDGQKKDFKKFFKPDKEGEYTIKLKIKNKIKNCNYMFLSCINIKSIDLSSFDASEVTNMSHMFSRCFNLEELNINNLITKNVKDMNHMFNKCKSLKEIKFPSTFNTENVTNISFMFLHCENLEKINLNFNTENVINMHGVFEHCYSLKTIDLSSFKTDKVSNMSYMFNECTQLEEIIIDSTKFKTNSVDNMGHIFNKCYSLKSINFGGFNTQKVKFMSYMFYKCQQLLNIDLSTFKNENTENMDCMFDGCSNLQELNLSSFKDNNKISYNKMFGECPKLKEVKIGDENLLTKFKKEFDKINFKI